MMMLVHSLQGTSRSC